MRRLIVIAALALGLAACGGSGVSKDALQITFGRTGGLIVPYEIKIAKDGTITVRGNPPVTPPKSLSSDQVETLSKQVRSGLGKLTSLQCAQTLPDAASDYITARGKTVVVRGACEPRFTKLFNALTNALGLNQ